MINIPSKSQKQLNALIDGLRILAWSAYKTENKKPEALSNLEFYSVFKEEWEAHEIHSYSLPKLLTFIQSLGYSEQDLLDLRAEYWAKKNSYRNSQTESRIQEFQSQYDEIQY